MDILKLVSFRGGCIYLLSFVWVWLRQFTYMQMVFFVHGNSYGIVFGGVGCDLVGCCLDGGVSIMCAIVVIPCVVCHWIRYVLLMAFVPPIYLLW